MTDSDYGLPLGQLWARALAPDAEELELPRADLPFSLAGGHSLAAARLIAGIRTELGRQVSIVDLLRADPTPDELAAMVATAPAAEDTAATEDAASQARTHGRAPLSRQMLPVWAFHRLHPDSAAYNVLRVLTIDGRPQPGALRTAAARLAERHDALRCCVREPRPGQPELVGLPSVTPSIGVQVVRLPAGRAGRPEEEVPDWEVSAPPAVEAALRAAADRPFDMATAPLWRIQVVFVPELARSWLLLATHHLIADLRATDVLLAELAAAYAAALPGAQSRETPVQDGPIQEAEAPSLLAHLIAEAEADRGPAGVAGRAADLAWWASQLGDRPLARPLPLAADPAPDSDDSHADNSYADNSYAGDAQTVPLDTEAVQQLARMLQVTNATVLLTAAAIVYASWRGDGHAVVGVPSARADGAGTDPVGFLVVTVPNPVAIDLRRSFAELCRQARAGFLDALEHASVTLGEIMARLALPRQSSRATVVDLWFNDLEHARVPLRFGELPVLEYDLVPSWALFLCGLYVRRGRSGLRLHGVVPRGTMRPDDLRAFLRQIRDLIDRCAREPERAVGQLLAPELAEPAQPALAEPAAIADRIEQIAAATPEAIAVRTADRAVSYRQLAADVRARAAGWDAGCRVAFGAHRDYQYVVNLIAAEAAGASIILIEAGWPPERQRAAIRLSRASHATGIDAAVLAGLDLAPPGDGGSTVQFTSGSTGVPLAVATAHRVRLACLDALADWLGIRAEDRVSFLSGPAHDPAWRDIGLPLRAGATLFLPSAQVQTDPSRLAGWLRENRITVASATPALLTLALEGSPDELPDLRLVVSGGAPLPYALAQRIRTRAPRASLVNGYGCTETPQLLTALRLDPDDPLPTGDDRSGGGGLSIGTPLPGRIAIVRNGAGTRCDVGQLGTVWAGAPHIAEGYLAPDGVQPDELGPGAGSRSGSAARFRTDPAGLRWFDTGDLARVDAAGNLTLAGRADRQRLVNGHRVVLDEIEAVARSQPKVSAALAEVVTVGSAQTLRLFVRRSEGADLTDSEVRETLRSRLPAAAMPARIVVLDDLPMNSNYKLRSPEVGGQAGEPMPAAGELTPAVGEPTPAVGEPLPATGESPPAAITALAESILGGPLRATDNFFEAGFNSLTLLHFGAELAGLLDREVPAIALFRYPSLHRLLAWLGMLGQPAAPAEHTGPRDRPEPAEGTGVRDRRRQLRRSIARQLGSGS